MERIEHDWDALFDGLTDRDIRTVLTDILQGDAGAQGTLEGLQERLASRVWSCQTRRFHVLQLDFSEAHPEGVEYVITDTDDVAHANREARFFSVPGNPAWVRDTRPEIKRA